MQLSLIEQHSRITVVITYHQYETIKTYRGELQVDELT
jgi:hypothetical protein